MKTESGDSSEANSQQLRNPSPWWTRATLLVSDLLSALLALVAANLFWLSGQSPDDALVYARFWPMVLALPLGFAFLGLYPAAGMSAVQEFRSLSLFITATFGSVLAALLIGGSTGRPSLSLTLVVWLFMLTAVPLGRATVRELAARREWWGLPAVMLGAGKTAELVIDRVEAQPGLDLKVIACLDDDPTKTGKTVGGVPVVGPLSAARSIHVQARAGYAIVAMPGLRPDELARVLQLHASVFPHVLVVPNTLEMSSASVGTRDLGGIVAFYNKQSLLLPYNRMLKRVLDAVLTIPFAVVALPVIGLCALVIYCVDRGNPFYAQKREGFQGRQIEILKLRSMRLDAEARLDHYLQENADARAEWEKHYKLARDPRILPVVGHLLRRTSLDELPQIWNVVKGEMSLVGPRPFPYYHLASFGNDFRQLRSSVKPGLTGYWQVTARSDADLIVQQRLDSYYIRNWSMWMDLYILARTPWAVLFGKGAR